MILSLNFQAIKTFWNISFEVKFPWIRSIVIAVFVLFQTRGAAGGPQCSYQSARSRERLPQAANFDCLPQPDLQSSRFSTEEKERAIISSSGKLCF